MPNLRQRIEVAERERFFGRAAELDTFTSLLNHGGEAPVVLSVSGPGGVGKTWLLHEFRRLAQAARRTVRLVDTRVIPPVPDALAEALAPDAPADPAARLSAERAVVLVDAFEELEPCSSYLQDVVGRLDGDVIVVIAGRRPVGSVWLEWREHVRTIALDVLTAAEADAYLTTRGMTDPGARAAITSVTGGLPLAVSSAADLVARYGVTSLAASPEWHAEVRHIVDRLLSSVRDARLRDAVEVAALVPRVDESLLAAVTGRGDLDESFAMLCQFAFVRPTVRGVRLHDDIRRLIADDLRWRSPERYARLRTAISSYYRTRQRHADTDERAELWSERISVTAETLLGSDAPLEQVTVEHVVIGPLHGVSASTTSEVAEVLGRRTPGYDLVAPPDERSRVLHRRVLDQPGTSLLLARDGGGRPVGFRFVLPLCRRALEAFDEHGIVRATTRYALGRPDSLPDDPDAASGCHLSNICVVPDAGPAAARALDLWALRQFHRWDLVVFCTAHRRFQAVADRLGFVVLPDAARAPTGSQVRGFVLDLGLVGIEHWIDAVSAGRRPVRICRGTDLESRVLDLLESWEDDARAAGSALATIARACGDDAAPEAAARRLVVDALDLLTSAGGSGATDAETLRSAYLRHDISATAAARGLAMSRATYYRTRARAVGTLASAVVSTVRARRAVGVDRA